MYRYSKVGEVKHEFSKIAKNLLLSFSELVKLQKTSVVQKGKRPLKRCNPKFDCSKRRFVPSGKLQKFKIKRIFHKGERPS